MLALRQVRVSLVLIKDMVSLSNHNLSLKLCLALSIMIRMKTQEIAKVLGRRGGQARARRLSVADKKRIASLGGQARAESFLLKRRIARNFHYAAVLRELAGRSYQVRRVKNTRERLPGIHDQHR